MQPPDTNPAEWAMFLEEAGGLIDALNEHVVHLEQEGSDTALLQEIFRAAHTLKGSSGMLGLDEMAGLTHAMEDLLDALRHDRLRVTESTVDALLAALDYLKAIKDQLQAGDGGSPIDTSGTVAALRAALESEPDAAGSEPDGGPPTALHALHRDAEAGQAVRALLDEQTEVFQVLAHLDPASDWRAVRCLQLLNALEETGYVILSVPAAPVIETGESGNRLSALVTGAAEEAIHLACSAVEEIEGVEVTRVMAADLDASPPDAGGEQGRREATAESAKVDALQSSVRIEVGELDAMMNMVGELVIDRTRIAQLSRELDARFGDDEIVRSVGETAQHIEKLVDELHDRMLQARMLPVGLLFSKFPRLVRDLSRSLGRPIRLEMAGEETEIDRSIIDKIKDPLVHLIRNACDHGIESPDERAAAGKPEQATLRLVASHDQGQIVISISDDGRGIDAQRVRARAVERGIITAEAAERMGDAEAVELIFAPGLSTAAVTTEVSGRGVGMDIVRRDIESLNGHIEVDTAPGRGTSFSLRLPLTLATFRGLLVRSGDTAFAIPLSYVRETLKPEPGQLQTVAGRPALHLRTRDTVIPVAWLHEVLGIGRMVAPRATEPYVVVVRGSDSETDRPLAIAVDELIDQQDIVVKSLSSLMGRARGVAGASILGDGQVLLILDVPALVKSSQAEQPPGTLAAVAERSVA